jgi:hypothetical protein
MAMPVLTKKIRYVLLEMIERDDQTVTEKLILCT